MSRFIGKRLIFGTVGIICVTIASIKLNYPAEDYVDLITIIAGLFIAGQTITDLKKPKQEGDSK